MALVVQARAKINLSLDVLARRPDGFHEVRMVMQSIDLHDRLEFAPAMNLSLASDHPQLPIDERNDIIRAARLLQMRYAVSDGARIHLIKKIPVAAGMAGGSTDGAAALWGLNRLWGLGLENEQLQALAAELGSDMPFCVVGGTALASGRGERLTDLPPAPTLDLVLMKPDFGVSTKSVYGGLELDRLPPSATDQMVELIRQRDRDGVIRGLANHLETVTFALYPALSDRRQKAMDLGALNCRMSGSGPTLFAVARDEQHAHELAAQLQSPGWWVQVAQTAPRGLTIESP
ncbi:MAG: 4-(cytidine 5'-diphospho)-2-C-methyl-D-erythritol kinase [Bacillota bacterium]